MRFDNLILDGVLNHSWLHSDQHRMAQYIQDQYVADLHNAMGGASPYGFFAHLYINGLYWGMYYVHDRPDHAWAAEMFGGDKDEYHAVKHSPGDVINNGNGKSAFDSLQAMVAMARQVQNDPNNLELWDNFTQQLDIDNFITYLLANWLAGNHDWPQKNWYATARDGGPWRFHSWDAEHVTDTLNNNSLRQSPLGLHLSLSTNAEYLTRMADLIYKHFFNDGVLSVAGSTALWVRRMEEVDRAIVGESVRWGDNRSSVPHTRSDWLDYNGENGKLTNFFATRSDVVMNQIRTAGLFPDTDPPTYNLRGGKVTSSFEIELAALQGAIYYTTDGSDPRAPGGGISPQAIAYTGGFRLPKNSTVKARAWNDGQWSALNEAAFEVLSELPLRITELNYNPHAANPVAGMGELPADNDQFEFLELRNIGSEPIDLGGVTLVETGDQGDRQGITFTFAPEQMLGPGAFVVIVSDRAAFESRYGATVPIARGDDGTDGPDGQYQGRLSNSGEQLTLLDAGGAVIQQLRYETGGPWPARAMRRKFAGSDRRGGRLCRFEKLASQRRIRRLAGLGRAGPRRAGGDQRSAGQPRRRRTRPHRTAQHDLQRHQHPELVPERQ